MVIGSDGRVEGSVSGGCVEADVIHAGRDIIDGAPPALLNYGGAEANRWGVQLACGGSLAIFVEAVHSLSSPAGTFSADLLDRVVRGMDERRALALLRTLDGAGHAVVADGLMVPESDRVPPEIVSGAGGPESDRCFRLEDGTGQIWFWQGICPPVRLIVIGAVHIAQTLTAMGAAMGFETIVIDPRGGLATPERFRDAELMVEWPDEALAELQIDTRTAIVTLTHDAKLDDPALGVAVRSPAFYIGALGSRRTHAARLRRLQGEGVEEQLLKKIRGPVGLPVGAVGAQEIAVSILADIIAVRRGAPLAVREDWWSPARTSALTDESCVAGSEGEFS
ncbi:xanthine dehydrogenase accessory factor XdhC/CoxI [Acetobacter oeni LMG 21952]|nr:xanthine dehydrogenase accessory factor XdhC/CoxI [Acetobacter oeni LMG 21952]